MRKISIPAMLAAAVAIASVVAVISYALVSHPDRPRSQVQPTASAQGLPNPVSTSNHDAVPPPKAGVLLLATEEEGRRACSSDGRWCVSLSDETDDDGIRRPVIRPPDVHISALVEEAGSEETYVVWPRLILLDDGDLLAGVETRLSTSYSGGGGSATALRLFKMTKDGVSSGAPVLTIPVQASLLIRACFSEADLETRAEACHDEYGFKGKVGIEAATHRMPRITYSTQAWAFPRGASRDSDSATRGPLVPADLVREPDDKCSFSRRFEFDEATGVYQPDRPLPDCTAYTVP